MYALQVKDTFSLLNNIIFGQEREVHATFRIPMAQIEKYCIVHLTLEPYLYME